MTISIRTRRSHWHLAGACVCLLLLIAGAGLLSLRGTSAYSGAAAAQATPVDRRLVLYRHTVPFSGTLTGGVALTGTLSPSLPGVNTVTLSLHVPDWQVARDGQVKLTISMPGMAMRPIRTTLVAGSGGYRGYAALPMFGRYHADVRASLNGRHYAGQFFLTLPLTLNVR